MIDCLSRRRGLCAAESTLDAWLTSSGWRLDVACPRFPWSDPEGVDTWDLRDAVRALAQVVAARKLRARGWIVGAVGPGASLNPGWARPSQGGREMTLAAALRCEGIDGVYLEAP